MPSRGKSRESANMVALAVYHPEQPRKVHETIGNRGRVGRSYQLTFDIESRFRAPKIWVVISLDVDEVVIEDKDDDRSYTVAIRQSSGTGTFVMLKHIRVPVSAIACSSILLWTFRWDY